MKLGQYAFPQNSSLQSNNKIILWNMSTSLVNDTTQSVKQWHSLLAYNHVLMKWNIQRACTCDFCAVSESTEKNTCSTLMWRRVRVSSFGILNNDDEHSLLASCPKVMSCNLISSICWSKIQIHHCTLCGHKSEHKTLPFWRPVSDYRLHLPYKTK